MRSRKLARRTKALQDKRLALLKEGSRGIKGTRYEAAIKDPRHVFLIEEAAEERWFQLMWNSNHRPYQRLAAQIVVSSTTLEKHYGTFL